MCRWLAYQGSPIYLDELVYEPEHSLVNQSINARKAVTRVNADGFGLGWYTERETPGQFHEVLPAWSDENLLALTHHIRSHRFMAHVRASTGSQVSRANCHPFIHHNWMFLHNGQIGEFDRVKYCLEHLLPEPLYLLKKGCTDSELIFLLMLKNGLQQAPEQAVQVTLDEINQVRKSKGVQEAFKASLCISDGEQFWVVRYSTDNNPPTVYMRCQEDSIIFASEPLDRQAPWESIPAQTLLHSAGGQLFSRSLS